ncbi:MAG: alanine racemase [Aeromicrobium sp.]
MSGPQAEAVIDLDAYRANLEALGACAPGAALMAVVKADAYGHGMAECAQAAREAGADWLGVATPDEALALRSLGDSGPVLCWLAAPGADFASVVDADVEVTASSVEQLEEILSGVRSRPRVQLKVDTGLSRNGAFGEQWSRLVEATAQAQSAGRLEHTGTWSHFACADEPRHRANDTQEKVFAEAVAELEAAGLEPGLRHLSNSAATLTRPSAHLDLVRVGISSYGLAPAGRMQLDTPLRPVMTLRGRLAAVRRVPAGTSVSYGHRYTTDRETTLGLVPIGYAEGLPRNASNRVEAALGGERVRVAGTICMDQVVVDLGDRPAERGDVVTLFGPGDDGEPTVQAWADAADTITYEVVTRIGGRTVRTYRGAP